MRITYCGHSCFTLESQGYRIAIDPYRDYVPGYRPLRLEAQAAFCSHGHDDHCWVQAVEKPAGSVPDPFAVAEIAGFHDDVCGAKRGLNTMRIFEAEGLRVAHLGDIGCFPPEEDLQKLKDLDACLVPVGGHYTIDARQAKELMDLLKPRVILPMHYRLNGYGFPEIGTLDAFLSLYPADAVTLPGSNAFDLTEDCPSGVVVLQYQ